MTPGPPAPIDTDPNEPVPYTRMRALMLADYYGWLTYLWPVSPEEVDPARWQYAYLPAGVTLEDLGDADPPTLHASEVLPFCYALAAAAGRADSMAYRDGLPGRKGDTGPACEWTRNVPASARG